MHDGAHGADQRTKDGAGDGVAVTLRDRIERDPNVRLAAVAAATNWALANPIPAWSLAVGANAEKLAAAWGEAVAARVLVAVGMALEVLPQCVIPGCPVDVDPDQLVELATATSPYRELRPACPEHLARLRTIGLPVRRRTS